MSKSDFFGTLTFRNDQKFAGHNFSLLHVDYVKLNEKWNYSNVISPYFRIYYIEGGGYINGQGEKLTLRPGHFYILPSFTVCSMKCPDLRSCFIASYFKTGQDQNICHGWFVNITPSQDPGRTSFYTKHGYQLQKN